MAKERSLLEIVAPAAAKGGRACLHPLNGKCCVGDEEVYACCFFSINFTIHGRVLGGIVAVVVELSRIAQASRARAEVETVMYQTKSSSCLMGGKFPYVRSICNGERYSVSGFWCLGCFLFITYLLFAVELWNRGREASFFAPESGKPKRELVVIVQYVYAPHNSSKSNLCRNTHRVAH